MAATGVAVHLYWNGTAKTEKYDVVYEGDAMKVMPIKLNYGTTYAGLLDKIYATTGIEEKDFELNIICRYPISSREYKPIPIKNDEAVELMLEVPCRSFRVYCVEIYLEKEARQCVKMTVSHTDSSPSLVDLNNKIKIAQALRQNSHHPITC